MSMPVRIRRTSSRASFTRNRSSVRVRYRPQREPRQDGSPDGASSLPADGVGKQGAERASTDTANGPRPSAAR
jgi:hypothetical protein